MKEMPLTVKRSIELLGLSLCIAIFAIASDIIMPVIMAFFISILLLPVYRFLRKYKFPEALAIILPILMVFIFIAGIIWFFSAQIGILVNDFPQIKENVAKHLQSLQQWISGFTDFSIAKQKQFITEKSDDLLNMAGKAASGAALTLSGVFVFLGLIPIYVYLILFYKDILLRFAFMWFKVEDHAKVKEAVYESESIIKNYLVGLLIQITYMTVFLGGILMLFGIKHALLIGVIFAILNLIPYVGALIGNILGVLITLSSSTELSPVITVLLVIAVVQFFDNNILMPRIVGSKVKINALVSILGVVIGGTIAGISGMFISMPLIAVLKVIFDRSEAFKHWGILFGDERPAKSPMSFAIYRKKGPVKTKSGTIAKK
ncbi:AI-2E family transporter [Pedobacter sp. UBA4863]|uniref:AI-2E family transporter n=1 Tax=Pedobacter sp. UBA4863 TaxID=1947060 RepID=UPI0025E80CF9|nr:AI-2E family transporter [Pedobacter sp. UBA4863]